MANKEALKALQERLAQRLQDARQQAPARSWLAVDIAGQGFLLPLDQAGEIFSPSALHAVPHSRPWFLGVANLRGQLHGVVDLASFLGMPRLQPALPAVPEGRDPSRLVAFNAALQVNAALWVDRLLGLRNAAALQLAPQGGAGEKPGFMGQTMRDDQGRTWYELNLAALSADDAFLRIDA
ncbi:chemotaxis protein CheW [Aquabacterium fontiphilum]|jgi:twitching motility protein PilI|uniref:chemotaxis protein CheW n=1 Tax=Aquabacterium fontiphilum TaxID=450365 RepID=UPI0013784DCB|nr:chemotaxis protein CheW [Aquabacterium fontiphilum]NBD19747.1 chemotaxis protein CheW [Aquabacterium fontiphilum]